MDMGMDLDLQQLETAMAAGSSRAGRVLSYLSRSDSVRDIHAFEAEEGMLAWGQVSHRPEQHGPRLIPAERDSIYALTKGVRHALGFQWERPDRDKPLQVDEATRNTPAHRLADTLRHASSARVLRWAFAKHKGLSIDRFAIGLLSAERPPDWHREQDRAKAAFDHFSFTSGHLDLVSAESTKLVALSQNGLRGPKKRQSMDLHKATILASLDMLAKFRIDVTYPFETNA